MVKFIMMRCAYKARRIRNKHCEGSCELLSLNMILMLTSC